MQKPNLKNAAASQVERAQGFGKKLMQQVFGLTSNFENARDLVQNNYNLGLRHLTLGNFKDAVLRFKLVTWLNPGHVQAWYHLGRALLAEGKTEQAATAFRKALKFKPNYEEAAYMLALAQGATTPLAELPKRIPPSLAFNHFEALAEDYTRQQLEAGYQGHTLLVAAIRTALVPGRIDHVILELGVGTGLVGPGLRDVAASITGVDFSGRMLEQAMQVKDAQDKKIYDVLIKRELHGFLEEATADSCDIVLAANTFNYLGDLHDIFPHIARILRDGGVFAFTAAMQETPEFHFDPRAGHFRYSQLYLRTQASMVGLKEIQCELAPVYPDAKMWLCIFKKG